jgi:hypothetical protein
MKLKLLILATALLGLTGIIPAAAGVMCTTFGNVTTCYDTNGGSQTATCTTFGNTVTCN